MIKGKPISLATFTALARVVMGSSVPGRIGTPAALAKARASVLSPILRSNSGRGPTKVSPAFAQASAKSAFSARNP